MCTPILLEVLMLPQPCGSITFSSGDQGLLNHFSLHSHDCLSFMVFVFELCMHPSLPDAKDLPPQGERSPHTVPPGFDGGSKNTGLRESIGCRHPREADNGATRSAILGQVTVPALTHGWFSRPSSEGSLQPTTPSLCRLTSRYSSRSTLYRYIRPRISPWALLPTSGRYRT